MRELNAREKNLGVIVTLVVMLGASSWVDRNLKRRNDALRAEVTAAQEQLRQAQVLLATPAPVSAAPVGAPASAAQTTAPTLTLLKDLTSPGESAGIRVVDVERTGDAGFRL